MRLNIKRLAGNLGVRQKQVQAAIRSLQSGYSVPYLAYYGRSRTGGLSETALREIARYLEEQQRLEERKQSVLKHIEGQDRLTEELRESILRAEDGPQLEELFFPFKQPQETPADQAHAQGLSKVADAVWKADPVAEHLQELLPTFVNPDVGLKTPEEVLEGLRHLLAERLAQVWRWRRVGRKALSKTAVLVARRHPELQDGEGQEFRAFFDFRERVAKVKRYMLLALVRGERERALQLDIEFDQEKVRQALLEEFPVSEHPHLDLIRSAANEAIDFYLIPALVGELRRRLYQRAEEYAASVMAHHLRQLLLVRPMSGYRVLAIDPALRPGCRVAVVDENGNVQACLSLHLLDSHRPSRTSKEKSREPESKSAQETGKTVEPHAQDAGSYAAGTEEATVLALETLSHSSDAANSRADREALPGSRDSTSSTHAAWPADVEQLCELIRRHEVQVIVIGNNNHYREVEELVAELISRQLPELQYSIVSEVGAAQYAGSILGKEELPNLEAGLRLAVSLGRRFQDMLAELVKVDVPSLVGHLNWYDITMRRAQETVRHTLESVVNWVGVDLNQANYAQLRYVAGLNEHLARMIVDYRKQHGPFRRREELLQVPGITEAVYRQAVGFLRIPDGDEPLDATWLHPEQYPLANRLLERLGFNAEAIKDPFRRRQLRQALSQADTRQLAEELECSATLLREVMNHVAAAGHDPRWVYPAPILRQRVVPLEELRAGQLVQGMVLRITDFGAFLDIGAEETGLLHKSHLGHKKFHSPREVIGVGEVHYVWIVQVDKVNKRIGLSLVPPTKYRTRRGRVRRRPAVTAPRETPPVVMQVQPPGPPMAAKPGPRVPEPVEAAAPRTELTAGEEQPAIPAAPAAPSLAATPAPPVEPSGAPTPPPSVEPKPVVAEAEPEVPVRPPTPPKTSTGPAPEKPATLRPVREPPRIPEPSPEALLGKKELRTFAELKALFEARQRLQTYAEPQTTPPASESSASSDRAGDSSNS
ncbi:30S ribosomal protein S1 [bacterium HR36]|nr:30S ribosomal protein S1 [bacterium HR36]